MLSNYTHETRSVTYPFVWWNNAFTEEQLAQIEHYCSTLPAKEGTIMGGEDVDKVRKSKVAFFERNDDNSWIFDCFNNPLSRLNEQYYGFKLTGYDAIQYTEYHGSEEGKYDWHMDTGLGQTNFPEPRKLSMTMLLNTPGVDFEGGDFQINQGREAKPTTTNADKGRIVVFPSFLIHRVAPVTSGVRKSLVIWVTGPKFQ